MIMWWLELRPAIAGNNILNVMLWLRPANACNYIECYMDVGIDDGVDQLMLGLFLE